LKLDDLLSAWPIVGPLAVQPITPGNNNLSYAVGTPGAQYILRIYQNTAEQDWICYEHSLLLRLDQLGLSFSVPAPIPARSGATLLPMPDGDGRLFAALFRYISGQQPSGDDLAQYRRCGAALAELDHALGRVRINAPPAPRPPFGDLAQIHPAVPDPRGMLEHLPLEHTQRVQLSRIVGDLLAVLPALYQSLPQQIVHRDFDASNVLMAGDRVSGVLDFEFAGPDVRALDLARSLSMFTISPWNIPDGWERVTAFILGYREHIELTPAEIETLPELMRLYRTWSMVHREGRRREGLVSEADVLARAMALFRQDEWLGEQHQELERLLASPG